MCTSLTKLCCPPLSRKRGDIKSHSSVCPSVHQSVCHKNFNLAHIFWIIKDRALIFGMHDPCVKPFQVTPCFDLDLWPSSRSKLLPGGGPQFSEFFKVTKVNDLVTFMLKVAFAFRFWRQMFRSANIFLTANASPGKLVSNSKTTIYVPEQSKNCTFIP